jgi:hypothetical protein
LPHSLAERCARCGGESGGAGFDGKRRPAEKMLSRNLTAVFLARKGIDNKAVACRQGMKIAYRTSATYFVYLQTISDRDGRWLLSRMRLTWPLSMAKEEGVGCARHAVFVLLLAPLCAGAVRTASACFLSRFVRLAAWSCRQPVPGGALARSTLADRVGRIGVALEALGDRLAESHPQVILANRQGVVSRSLFNVVQVDADGTVTYRRRYSGMLSQPLQLSDFPMGRHRFTIQFASVAYSTDELEFVPAPFAYDPAIVGGRSSTSFPFRTGHCSATRP